jgi:hypothetical protein
MSVFIGTFFSKKHKFYCNIRQTFIDKYIVNPLYSTNYLIIDNKTFLDNYEPCSSELSKTVYSIDNYCSHLNIKNENVYLLFGDIFNQDENNIFIPRDYDYEELKNFIIKIIFNKYNNSHKTMYSENSLNINITELKIINKTDNFLKISVSFDFFVKPHCIKHTFYEFKSIDNIIKFLQDEIKISKSIMDDIEINIIETF